MGLKFIEAKRNKKFSRRDLLIGFTAILAIAVNLLFPQTAYGETFWLSFFLFVVFPVLIIIFILREPLANFGLSRGLAQRGFFFSAITIILFIFLNYLLVFHSKYAGQLSISPFIISRFTIFLLFEIFIALPLHFFWEFFFRGFLQMGLERRFGIYSLPLAALLQALLFFRSSWIAILLVLLSALAAGFIVRRSRSIAYSAFSLWIISVSLDIMIIILVHQIAR
ncbi:MAG TPA: CPBP family glutamic-type intramembrane protease [Candidatus Bathyarchaeia archaeon]|nr:CPBP family glutamic-type intramembrane protease [Candidatus Bathyarchaeia archaeon]